MGVMGGIAGIFSEAPEPRDFPALVSNWGEILLGSWNPCCFQVLAGGQGGAWEEFWLSKMSRLQC
jgi:hypothetical protein